MPRWAAARRTRTFHRFHARSSPAFTDAAPAATDETSVVPVAPQQTCQGLITDCTRACGGISRGALRTTRPTMDGRATVTRERPLARPSGCLRQGSLRSFGRPCAMLGLFRPSVSIAAAHFVTLPRASDGRATGGTRAAGAGRPPYHGRTGGGAADNAHQTGNRSTNRYHLPPLKSSTTGCA